MTMAWDGLWGPTSGGTTRDKDTKQTRDPEPRMDMSKLTPEIKTKLAQSVEEYLYTWRKKINRIRKDDTTDAAAKADRLTTIYDEAHLMPGRKLLAVSKERRGQKGMDRMQKANDRLAQWDRMHELIGVWIYSNQGRPDHPEPLGVEAVSLVDSLNKHGAGVPQSYQARKRWWGAHDSNRAAIGNIGAGGLMTDAMASANKKQFFRQLLKPHSTTHISSLTGRGTLPGSGRRDRGRST